MAEDNHLDPAQSGFVRNQIAKALITEGEHADSDARDRATLKIEKWLTVIEGNLCGEIKTGSRTPVAGVPAWATLEVVTGGFATGQLLAGGDLKDHELALFEKFGLQTNEEEPRLALNKFFISDDGISELSSWLENGLYHIDTPEEGALLVVAWLVKNQSSENARQIIEEISPWFEQLRFFPEPSERAKVSETLVCVRNVGDSIKSVEKVRPNERILQQNETLKIWNPFFDRMILCFLEIFEGEVPSLCPNENNSASGGVIDIGKVNSEWLSKAEDLFIEFEELRATWRRCQKPDQKKGNFYCLLSQFRGIRETGKNWLNDQNKARIRLIIARAVTKRGKPSSDQFNQLRKIQHTQASAPIFSDLAKVLNLRLNLVKDKKEGLLNPSEYLGPVLDKELSSDIKNAAIEIPASLRQKVEKSVLDTPQGLIERGYLSSAEALAKLTPQLVANVRSGQIEAPDLSRLDQKIYRAFRRRRSLLLLNLDSQVKIEELPWMAKLKPFQRRKESSSHMAHKVLTDLALLSQKSFPQTIFPNKLLQEFVALAKLADLDLPLVDELAADIFMGQFSVKFIDAASRTGELVNDTIYSRYYDIDCDSLIKLKTPTKPKRFRKAAPSSNQLLRICENRAGVKFGGWNVVHNGMILEQLQIVTTHNLALINANLMTSLDNEALREMSETIFTWICRRLQIKQESRHAQLISLKKSAYAWRQMVYYLSQLDSVDQNKSMEAIMAEHLRQSEAFQDRFSFAVERLFDASERNPMGKHVPFYGWVLGSHQLITRDTTGT